MEFRQVGFDGFTELSAEFIESSENRCSLEVLFSSTGSVSATQKASINMFKMMDITPWLLKALLHSLEGLTDCNPVNKSPVRRSLRLNVCPFSSTDHWAPIVF